LVLRGQRPRHPNPAIIRIFPVNTFTYGLTLRLFKLFFPFSAPTGRP